MSTHRSEGGTESCKRKLSTRTGEYTESGRPQARVESWLFRPYGMPVTAVGAAVTGVVAGDGSGVPPTAGRWAHPDVHIRERGERRIREHSNT